MNDDDKKFLEEPIKRAEIWYLQKQITGQNKYLLVVTILFFISVMAQTCSQCTRRSDDKQTESHDTIDTAFHPVISIDSDFSTHGCDAGVTTAFVYDMSGIVHFPEKIMDPTISFIFQRDTRIIDNDLTFISKLPENSKSGIMRLNEPFPIR